jgi:hypothetical protein
VIIYQGQAVLVITKNRYIQGIDPDFLLGVYAQLNRSSQNYNYYGSNMAQLARASQIMAQMFHP